jgi:hypothetical protein
VIAYFLLESTMCMFFTVVGYNSCFLCRVSHSIEWLHQYKKDAYKGTSLSFSCFTLMGPQDRVGIKEDESDIRANGTWKALIRIIKQAHICQEVHKVHVTMSEYRFRPQGTSSYLPANRNTKKLTHPTFSCISIWGAWRAYTCTGRLKSHCMTVRWHCPHHRSTTLHPPQIWLLSLACSMLPQM